MFLLFLPILTTVALAPKEDREIAANLDSNRISTIITVVVMKMMIVNTGVCAFANTMPQRRQ